MNRPNAEPPHLLRRWRWPMIVVGLLLTHVVCMVIAVVIATTDRSFVVLPDYYKRSLQWDDHKAALAASDRLGWKRVLTLGEFDPAARTRLATLKFTDGAGKGVDGLTVSMEATADMDSAHRQALTFRPVGDGAYQTVLKVTHDGNWALEIDARRGDEHYVTTAAAWIGR